MPPIGPIIPTDGGHGTLTGGSGILSGNLNGAGTGIAIGAGMCTGTGAGIGCGFGFGLMGKIGFGLPSLNAVGLAIGAGR